MNLKAKPLLKGKIWVLERDGVKVGALQKAEDGLTVITENKKEKFLTPQELKAKYSISYEKEQKSKPKSNIVYDFPCESYPYNDMYDVRNKVPVFTKDENSKSYYCAGYYLINTGKWEIMYCPKLLIVSRYEHVGPFKTEEEANVEIQKRIN